MSHSNNVLAQLIWPMHQMGVPHTITGHFPVKPYSALCRVFAASKHKPSRFYGLKN